MNVTAAIVLLAGAAQETAARPDDGWKPLNRAALIVNEAIVTDEEVRRAVMRRREPINTQEEFRRRQGEVVQQKVRELLEEQAGKVLGYDPQVIERFVANELDRQREDAGSISALAEVLRERNLDSFTRRDDVRTHVYGELWQGAMTGVYAGPGGRPTRDRYVRPGRLEFEYRWQATNPRPPQVTLHEIMAPIGREQTAQEAKSAAGTLRERMREGATFEEIAAEINPDQPEAGLLKPMREDLLRQLPDVYEFVRSAKPGDVSEPLAAVIDGTVRGYRIIKLVERVHAELPAFDDREFQAELRKRVQESLDSYRIQVGLDRLLDAAYVWPPESFARPSSIEPNP